MLLRWTPSVPVECGLSVAARYYQEEIKNDSMVAYPVCGPRVLVANRWTTALRVG